jgi:hypothetical protein
MQKTTVTQEILFKIIFEGIKSIRLSFSTNLPTIIKTNFINLLFVHHIWKSCSIKKKSRTIIST